MLSHRPYIRGDYQREKTSGLTWLLSAVIAGFVLQALMGSSWFSGAGNQLKSLFALSISTLHDGWVWTLFTHSFLHSTDFVFHVVINCVLLYFLGRELLPILGTRRLLGLYAVATVVGGLAWAAVHWRFGGGELLGATAAVDALLIVFACFFPNQPMSFLLFFVVPVTLKPKHVVGALMLLDVVLLLAYELPGQPLPLEMSIASSAHLGGWLTGWIYARHVHDAAWFNPQDRVGVELPKWIPRPKAAAANAAIEPVAPPPAATKEELRAEADRILDKINSHGFAALTADEKRVLNEARNLLSRK